MPKCPSCTAQNPDGVTVCEFCGQQITAQAQTNSPEPLPPQTPTTEETPLDSSKEEVPVAAANATGGKKSFKCESCGAVVAYSAGQQALNCAYCGSNYVVDTPTRPDMEEPKRIVPFVVDQENARKLFQDWLGKGFWRPGDLKSSARMDALAGVYLPFWSYDVQTDSNWSASAGYRYTENETYTDSDGNLKTKKVTKTRWQPANGEHQFLYRDWLISASGGLDQDWVSQIIPFDLDKAKPYSSDYFAGWAAEEYSIDSDRGRISAETEINEEEIDKCAKMVPGDTHKDLRVSTRFSDWLHELIVLPIWISSYKYKGKIFRFLVNGQTGEVVGKAPVSKLKIAIAILAAVLGIGGGLLAYHLLQK